MPRLVVNPGEAVISTWGNTVFDQSVQAFTNTADRATQWPTPLDGSMSYTTDTGSLWVRRAGVWKMLPLGFIASAIGPATAVACGQTPATILSLTAPLTAGRRYRLTVWSFGQQSATASADTRTTIASALANLPAGIRVMAETPGPASAFMSAGFAWVFTASTTATDTFTLAGQSTTGGTFTATANLSQIALEDIGA